MVYRPPSPSPSSPFLLIAILVSALAAALGLYKSLSTTTATMSETTHQQAEPSTHTGRNIEFFDKMSKNYDTEDWVKRLGVTFTKELQDRADWIGVDWAKPGEEERQVTMLDFACGPGMASHAFLDRVTQTRGVDISPGMVEEYNRRASEKGLTPQRMHAAIGDLLAEDPAAEKAIAGPDFFGFDFATITWALHHMEKPDLTLARMVQRLKPGGTVVVLDWTDGEVNDQVSQAAHGHNHGHDHDHDHQHQHHHHHQHPHDHGGSAQDAALFGAAGANHPSHGTIAHHGFSRAQIEQLLRDAGCSETDYVGCNEVFSFGGDRAGMERRAFIARGKKAS